MAKAVYNNMTTENLIELEVSLRNIERTLFDDKELFRVWVRVREARELMGEHIRKGSEFQLEP